MRIIKVSATESTNILAREWHQVNPIGAPICFIAREQTSGRGQRGASWISNAGENLTFSVLFPKPDLEIKEQFALSAAVGIAVLEALLEFKFQNLKLKWPNDIMAGNFKIGGILIENILNNGRIGASVIGVGLNVNQISFPGVPKASSLRLLSGEEFNNEKVLNAILKKLEKILSEVGKNVDKILSEYEKVLFKKGKVSTFQMPDNSFLSGIIKGITSTGLLKVQVEDETINTFDLKELKLLF